MIIEMSKDNDARASWLFIPLVIAHAITMGIIIQFVRSREMSTQSFAKVAASDCKKGTIFCGVTDTCLSYAACVTAGKPSADAAKAKTQALASQVTISPAARITDNACPGGMFRCTCGCFTKAQFDSIQTVNCSDMCEATSRRNISTTTPTIQTPTIPTTPTGAASTPVSQVSPTQAVSTPSVGSLLAPVTCSAENFRCTCGCFSAAQFRGARTDKCTDMCAAVGKKPIDVSVSGVLPAVPITTTTPLLSGGILTGNPSGTLKPTAGTYYSQVDPAWADQAIPGQERYSFVQAGCGEVTLANILTNSGIPTDPNQAAALMNPSPTSRGTSYQQALAALPSQKFTSTLYPSSFQTLPSVLGPNDVVWLAVKANNATYKNMGHHTYIDGYTIENGIPVYNLRDPFFGSDMKCTPKDDRSLDCSSPERSVRLDVPVTSDSDGGTAAVIISQK